MLALPTVAAMMVDEVIDATDMRCEDADALEHAKNAQALPFCDSASIHELRYVTRRLLYSMAVKHVNYLQFTDAAEESLGCGPKPICSTKSIGVLPRSEVLAYTQRVEYTRHKKDNKPMHSVATH